MIEILEHGSIAELRLQRPPVNAMNMAFLEAVIAAHKKAVKNQSQAIVISGKEGLFSAGLDVPELLQQSRNAMTVFWDRFFLMNMTLLRSPVPVIAAITGHAPAGGAVLAIHCDYRVAARGDFRMGLNEVQVGLAVPPTVLRVLESVVGRRTAARLAMTGELLSMDQALSLGLVDELVEPDKVIERAVEYAASLTRLPPRAMNQTRLNSRIPLLPTGHGGHGSGIDPDDIRAMADYWFLDETQAALQALAASLGK